MHIRPFCPDDQFAVKNLILAGLAERWGLLDPTQNPDLDDIAQTYADSTFLVAELDGWVVGTGALVRKTAAEGQILRMSVDPTVRRQQIGRRLLAALVEAAQQQQIRRLVLETTATWESAIAFYTACGFVPIGEFDGDLYFEYVLM